MSDDEKIVPFKRGPDAPATPAVIHEQVVKLLKELLVEAEAGTIKSFAYASVLADGDYDVGNSHTSDISLLVAAAALLQYRMISNWDAKD